MNIFRWVIGIPLALLIIIGIAMLNAHFQAGFYSNQLFRHFYLYYQALINMICFFLFVFLSSLFVPSKRKYAALIAALISILLASAGLYVSFTNRDIYGEIDMRFFLNFAGIFVGILTGIYVSYSVFKNKGWDAVEKPDNNTEVY
jgi:hypothetical protein